MIMSSKPDTTKFNIELETEEKNKFKAKCAEEGYTMRDAIRSFVRQFLNEKVELPKRQPK